MLTRILYISLFLGLTACQTDLDIPFPEHEPQLTLNGFLVEGQPFFLYVSRSFGALEDIQSFNDTTIVVADAEVSLWKDGNKVIDMAFLPAGVDTFLFDFQGVVDTFFQPVNNRVYLPEDSIPGPIAGETYEFRASHPTYGEASVAITVMPQVEIQDVTVVKDTLITTDFDGYQDRWSAVKITVMDPAGIANAYNFEGSLRFISEFDDGRGNVFRDTAQNIQSIYTEVTQEGDGVFFGTADPIFDDEFDGQTTTLFGWLRLPNCCGYPADLNNSPDVELLDFDITLYAIDSDFALFKEKHYLQRISRTEGIASAILPREPVSVIGNVVGGYGIVGSYNRSHFLFEFD